MRPQLTDGLFVAGYHPWWGVEGWEAYPWEGLDALYFFEIEVDGEGQLAQLHGWPGEWEALLEQARRARVQVIPALTMHENGAFARVFGDAERREVLLSNLLGFLGRYPEVRGLHLDFELFSPVPLDVRDGYTSFVAALDARMAAVDPGLGLSVFVLAFDDDDVYNEGALAQIADYVVVQGYDFHSAGSATTGPVTAEGGWGRLRWDEVIQRMEAHGVPRERTLLSVPLYGYEWPTEGPEPGAATRSVGTPIPLTAPASVLPDHPRARDQARIHGVMTDSVSGSRYYAYQDQQGGWMQGWYHDEDGIRRMVRYAREAGLGGVAFFPLTYGDAAVWEGIGRELEGR